jgi:hypothetical protein
LRISVRPVGHCVRGPSPACAIVTFVRGAFLQPRPFAWSGEKRVDEAIRCRQLRPLALRRTARPAPFRAPRMRTPRGPSRSLWSLHRIASTSDVLVVTRRHTRVGIRCPPDVLAVSSQSLSGARRGVDLRARGTLHGLPVRAGRAQARERLPSCRESASVNPQTARAETCWYPRVRAPFRLLPIRAPRQWSYELPSG